MPYVDERQAQGGLLDEFKGLLSGAGQFFGTPAGQGLLSAGLAYASNAGRRGMGPLNTAGAAGLAGLQGYSGAIDQQREVEQGKIRQKVYGAQLQGLETKNQADMLDLSQKRERLNYWGGQGKPNGPGVGMAASDNGGFSDGGMGPASLTEFAQRNNAPPAMPPPQMSPGPQINPLAALRLGYSVQEAQDLARMGAWGKPKVSHFQDVRTPNGVEVTGFDEFGQPVKTGQTPWKAPEYRDFGGYIGAIDQINGGVTNLGKKTMAPADTASDARARQRLQFDRDHLDYLRGKDAHEASTGVTYQQNAQGDLVALPKNVRPGMPVTSIPVFAGNGQPMQAKGSPKAAFAQQYEQVNGVLGEVKDLLGKATASGAGSARDATLGFFGKTTEGANAAAKLDTYGGWLTANVPRFEGPQGEKDVLAYQRMAGDVANRKLPMSQRLAQLDALTTFMDGRAASYGLPVIDRKAKQAGGAPDDVSAILKKHGVK